MEVRGHDMPLAGSESPTHHLSGCCSPFFAATMTGSPDAATPGVAQIELQVTEHSLELPTSKKEQVTQLMSADEPEPAPAAQTQVPAVGHSFFSGVWNFVNSIVGAGIIGLAFALNGAGLWLGLVMLVMIAILTDFSVNLLIRTGVKADCLGYEALCHSLFGNAGFWVTTVCMWFFATGAMLAYLVIIGDTVPVVLLRFTGLAFFQQRRTIIFLCAVFICFPLSALKDIGKLGSTSFLSIMAVCVIVVVVIFRSPSTADMQGIYALHQQREAEGFPEEAYSVVHDHFPQAFGGICFAFVCQHSSFLVRNSLQRPEKWAWVSKASVTLATVLSLLMATTGYASFLRCTRSNILNNLMADDPYANVARLLLALTMFLTYPMEFFVARQAIQSILVHHKCAAGKHPAHWTITLLLFLFTLVCGLYLPQVALGPILEFSGGFAAVMLGFVLPGACCLQHMRSAKAPLRLGGCVDAAGSLVLVVVGLVAMVMSTYSNIMSLLHESAQYLPWCPRTGVEA